MIPDVGPVVSAIADCSATGTCAKSKVELVLGKPNTFACDFEPLKTLVAESTLMIGDNLETDIRFGKNGNFNTALVLTGHSRKTETGSF